MSKITDIEIQLVKFDIRLSTKVKFVWIKQGQEKDLVLDLLEFYLLWINQTPFLYFLKCTNQIYL
jgi:hypothetical protein